MTAFLGIDPGAKGAIACIEGGVINIEDFPRHGDGSIDHIRLAEIVEQFDFAKFALIEDVHAMPGQGVCSMFSFGENFGALKQALSSARINWRAISAAKWKRAMGISADKDTSLGKALSLYPREEKNWRGPRGGLLDGRVEALLLAHLAMKTYQLEGNKIA